MKAESPGATWQRGGPEDSWDFYTRGQRPALFSGRYGGAGEWTICGQATDKMRSRALTLLTALAPHFPNQKKQSGV